MGNLVNSGVGNLKSPRVAGVSPTKAIPPADEGTIRVMMSEAQDATTAGADNVPANPKTAPGSNRSIPAGYRNAIVPPASWHVP